MTAPFFNVLRGEWLKQRRSLAMWMVVAGALFTPAIILVLRLLRYRELPALHASADYWTRLWHSAWESSAVFFLPMGAVLATSLIVQIEFRNNAWKQVHALPVSKATIYFCKLAIILSMLLLFVALFSVATWLTAAIPAVIVPGLQMPIASIPWRDFVLDDLGYIVGCLPIAALQYAIALRYRNPMVPIGAGFLLWVGTLGMLSTRWASLSPYSATMLQYIGEGSERKLPAPAFDIHATALVYFAIFVVAGYVLFATAKQKG